MPRARRVIGAPTSWPVPARPLPLLFPHTALDGSLDHPSLVVSTMAGANTGSLVDGRRWARRTPGVTKFTQDFNMLDIGSARHATESLIW